MSGNLHRPAVVPSRARDAGGLIVFLLLCFAVAAIGGAVTAKTVGGWYAELRKPDFNPPNWIFGPVWTALYAMMAVAAWRVWRQGGLRAAPVAMSLFAAQLLLNFLWSILFFGLRDIGAALVDIVLLVIAIYAMTFVFWRRDRIAGMLFVPYAAWVSFAAVLNAAIWRLN